jgi:hypothetical protein
MATVTIHSKEIVGANILQVQAGTNCPQGGDAGHGGRTVFRLIDCGGTAMQCRVNDGEPIDASRVEITMAGDSEHETFMQALEFALAVLRTRADKTTEEYVD